MTGADRARKIAALWGTLLALPAVAIDLIVDTRWTYAVAIGVLAGAVSAVVDPPATWQRALVIGLITAALVMGMEFVDFVLPW